MTTENAPVDENSFYPVASCIKSLSVNVLFALQSTLLSYILKKFQKQLCVLGRR